MKRLASLDFLRGLAAFAVAIPHYLTLNEGGSLAEACAVTGVEIFFVLSGYVLALQILTKVLPGPLVNLKIFLVRRWMRTIPPYLLALSAIAITTGEFLTPDFARYAFYIQNLFLQANSSDFFPVAWSLSVEEWFYVTFSPLLVAISALSRCKTRTFAAGFAACFILAVIVARSLAATDDWDGEIRRVTIFRVDSIAWGFLLYIATDKLRPFDLHRPHERVWFGLSIAMFVACYALCATISYNTIESSFSRALFPFSAATLGVSAIFVFRQSESIFARGMLRGFSFYLGHISYSVYLFHLLVAMILKPKLSGLGTLTQFVVYIGMLFGLTTIVWLYFERPILAARPRYDGIASSGRQTVADTTPHRPILAIVLAVCGCVIAYFCIRAYQGNHPRTFYLTFIAVWVTMLAAARGGNYARIGSACLTLLFVSILLPTADYVFRATKS
jgi:peptidoglycan/LPS O-acetylase OafA/YrhL